MSCALFRKILFLALTLSAATCLPARADTSQPIRAIVVLFDGLTADDIHDPSLPWLSTLARHGAVGLMNTAVAGPRTDTAAVLTLALGAQAPAEPADEETYRS